jgi:isocitrate dehydrogenase
MKGEKPDVPDVPIIPFIEGDGIGPDIWRAARLVLDAAVSASYGDRRRIEWREVLAGEKAYTETGEWLPMQTLETIREHVAAIKGPMTTPVGGGIRSLNVAIRQTLDLYACVRPVRFIEGVPNPMKRPEAIDMVVFRENTEDLYAGIEWESGTSEAKLVIDFLSERLNTKLSPTAGIGIKPITPENSRRLVSAAVDYALLHNRPSVTLMHKGNIMKFTEGAFAKWGYDAAREAYPESTITEDEVYKTHGGTPPPGRVVIKDRIADMLFQQVLLRPEEYHVIATPNLNGDYLSDALAAQVGGLGMAPGANIGDECAVFEATHGTAPKYAGMDKVNPGSLILSGAMMLEYLGWTEAAENVRNAVSRTIAEGVVTYDLARQLEDVKEVSCSGFAEAIARRLSSKP